MRLMGVETLRKAVLAGLVVAICVVTGVAFLLRNWQKR